MVEHPLKKTARIINKASPNEKSMSRDENHRLVKDDIVLAFRRIKHANNRIHLLKYSVTAKQIPNSVNSFHIIGEKLIGFADFFGWKENARISILHILKCILLIGNYLLSQISIGREIAFIVVEENRVIERS